MGLGRRTFAPGEVLTASNVMNYLMDQSVMNFAGTAARGSAIGTAASEGMVSYLNDTDNLEVYRTIGTAAPEWNPVAFRSEIVPNGLIPSTTGTATVAGAGSSISENSLGTLTFATATSLTLDGVFTSDYRNYRIVMDFQPSANATITSQYRASGSSITTANYTWGFSGVASGASSVNSAVQVASMQIGNATLVDSTNIICIDIMTPNISTLRTQFVGNYARSRDAIVVAGHHTVAQTVDGMTFVSTSGTITGRLTIYGWNQ